jgi:PAS domain S-box-containing protein
MGTPRTPHADVGPDAEDVRELRLRWQLLRELRHVGSVDRLLHVALRELAPHFGATDGVAVATDRTGNPRIVHRLGERKWDPAVARAILDTGRAPLPPEMLYLPVQERDRRVAVLILARPEPFRRDELAALRRCGEVLDESLDALAEARVFEVLARIERKIASELRTADLLYQILDGLQLLVRYDHSASILLLDRERSRLVVRADKVVWRKMKSPHVGKSLELDPGLADLLRVGDRAFLLDGGDAGPRGTAHPLAPEGDDGAPQEEPAALAALFELLCYSCRSGVGPAESTLMVVPLLFSDRLQGLLKLSSRSRQAFTPGDVTVVGRFVDKMSAAIRNAELYARRLDELRAINDIGQLVTRALPLEETYGRILEIVLRVMNLPVGSIELIDRDRGRLRKLASTGYTLEHPGLPLGEGITGSVAQSGEPILANDVAAHPKYLVHSERSCSELAVPIRFEGVTLGVLNVESYTPDRFRERDAQFLAILADKTAIALETLEQRQRQTSTLELLYELSARLAVPEDVQPLLQLTVDLTRKHLSCEVASIFLFADGRFRRRATSGLPPEWFPEESYSTGEGLTGRAAVLRPGPYPQPVVHNDVPRSGLTLPEMLRRFIAVVPSGRIAHLIALPLIENRRPIGILRVLNRLTHDGAIATSGFTPTDAMLLSTIASQVSLAVADLRKRERIRRMSARLEEQVRARTEEVERLATFVENAPLAIFWIDAEARLQFVNEAGEHMFGYQADELRGRRVDTGGSAILGEHYESLVQVVNYVGLWNGELECRRSDGSAFPVSLSACTIAAARGEPQGMVAFARDITATKELERELLQSEGKRAMADLASGVAHDVNNALGACLPLLQALAADIDEGRYDREKFSEDLRQIESYTRISVRIFQGMLAMARGTFAIDQEVDLNARIETALALVSFKLERAGIAVRRETTENLPRILAHPGRLEQAFHNLILNAVDAMPEGGTLTVRTWGDGARVHAEVEDSGTGIPEELLARVQEPFYTSKRHGTGLGLSVVRSIAWEHSGKLSLRSQVGRGTTVGIEFPVPTAQ